MIKKSCVVCGKEFTVDKYSKQKFCSDSCRKEQVRKRNSQYYQDHKDDIKEYYQEYTKNNREKFRTNSKKYRAAHKESIAEYTHQYYMSKKVQKLIDKLCPFNHDCNNCGLGYGMCVVKVDENDQIIKMKQCAVCGEWFKTTNLKRKYCSDECRKIGTKRSRIK